MQINKTRDDKGENKDEEKDPKLQKTNKKSTTGKSFFISN